MWWRVVVMLGGVGVGGATGLGICPLHHETGWQCGMELEPEADEALVEEALADPASTIAQA